MKVVLCHGVFDLLHTGHVHHLKKARAFGDKLIVSLVADSYVRKNRLICDQSERMEMLSAIRYVDDVFLCEAPGPEEIISKVVPDVYVRGSDYIGKRMPEEDLLERMGIQIRYTESVPPHTSEILERVLNVVAA